MTYLNHRLPGHFLLFVLLTLAATIPARAADDAQLISVTLTNGTPVLPRSQFTQTWTMKNTGTTTWSPTYNGYTMNVVGLDTLGAVPLVPKPFSSHTLSCTIESGASVLPGGQATFTMTFIALETPGPATDIFRLNNASSVFFGPSNILQVVVIDTGSTNQYDRARAVSYANNYCGYVNSDGYFWTNGSFYGTYIPRSPAPTSGFGDDCAHFVSCCIGSEPHVRGAGMDIPSRVPPTYGEPGAAHIVNTTLMAPGYAVEVFSLDDMEPGDLVGWNWSGDPDVGNLNHVTLYLGNGLLASHSSSSLDVSADTWYQSSEPLFVRHLIHILDSPALASFTDGQNLVLSWGTNWSKYALYSSTNLSDNTTWTKVVKSPVPIGKNNVMTNPAPSDAVFYRLMMP